MYSRINLLLLVTFFGLMLISCKDSDEPEKEIDLPETVTDIDGNVYRTIKIGNQIWMEENLKVTRYNDGTSIPNLADSEEWASTTVGAYCNFDNDESNVSKYGRLYNWYAIKSGKLAPEGWRVPNEDDFLFLILYLGGEKVAGGKLREPGTTHWVSSHESITNESGFSARGAGMRSSVLPQASYMEMKERAYFWAVNENNFIYTWYITSGRNDITRSVNSSPRNSGYSVRCIKKEK